MTGIFVVVGLVFGTVFVAVNAPDLPGPWSAVVLALGGVLLLVAVGRGIARGRGAGERVVGSARVYWLAVAAEVVAIPVGARLLDDVFGEPDLVVLWVVFVVGAHFLPARLFQIGRYAELGVVLMALAVVFAVVYLGADAGWAPAAGASAAGLALLAFSGGTSGGPFRSRPSPR